MTFPKTETKMTQRINRILSEAGLASRRKADELIRSGRVMFNGKILRELGTKAEWGKDSIKLDGREIPGPEEKIYLILNKPFGYVCTLNDPQGRPIVTDLLKDVPQRIYPVGRLDFDSMGLLLLTNDGDFSFQLTHPRYHIPRTYKVTVQGIVTEKNLDTLKAGIELEDGFISTSSAALIGRQGEKSLVRLTIAQGRNRIVRRIIEALGYSVVHLVRIGFGSLELGNLKVGKYRQLEPGEINELMEMTSQTGRKKGEGQGIKEKGKAKGSRFRGFEGSNSRSKDIGKRKKGI
jgi:23S rRNA pseudouridine2605 synthase